MNIWECSQCSYVYEGERPPYLCPQCGVSGDRFELVDETVDDWSDNQDWYDADEEEDTDTLD